MNNHLNNNLLLNGWLKGYCYVALLILKGYCYVALLILKGHCYVALLILKGHCYVALLILKRSVFKLQNYLNIIKKLIYIYI